MFDQSSDLDKRLHFVATTAGGWAGGSIAAEDLFVNSEKMIRTSLYPSMIAGKLATQYMIEVLYIHIPV